MADSNVLRLPSEPGTHLARTAPHNIEAEQALLGAILLNNDAFYRVSDFLEPKHFFETVHQDIFQVKASLVRLSKVVPPITLKTFFPVETKIHHFTIRHHFPRLPASPTQILQSHTIS